MEKEAGSGMNRIAIFDMEAFRTDLRLYRQRHDITYHALAHMAGINPSTMYGILYGKTRGMTMATIAPIAYAVDMSIDKYVKAAA